MAYLEDWSLLDKDHYSSLQGAIEALKASTLRLPVVGGVTVCCTFNLYTRPERMGTQDTVMTVCLLLLIG